MWAAPWTPDPSVTDASGRVRPEVVWAALDCPSGIAAAEAAGLGQEAAILHGRMTARLAVLPALGGECRVIAWPAGRDDRKLTAGSALLGPGGEVLAVAKAVRLVVPRPSSGRGRGRSVVTGHRRGVALTPMETRRDVIVRTATLADELGYELFAVPEGWGLDSAPVLAEIAMRTARIQLASGVLSVWGRTPATLAMTAPPPLTRSAAGVTCWAWARAPGHWWRASTTPCSSTQPASCATW